MDAAAVGAIPHELLTRIEDELTTLKLMLAARRERRAELGIKVAEAEAEIAEAHVVAAELEHLAAEVGAMVRADLQTLRRIVELEFLLDTGARRRARL